MLILLVAACVKTFPAGPSVRGLSEYDVAVVAASGPRQLSALYSLEITPATDTAWVFRTVRGEGTWEEGGKPLSFDSDKPSRSDPWPLRLQHVVSSVPAVVVVDASGAPMELVDPDGWSADVRRALYDTDLPVEAMRSGEALVDPVGMVADLRRSFPGRPPSEEWVRHGRVAGLQVERRESCTETREGRVQVFRCDGTVRGPDDGSARLHDVTTWTELRLDRHGMASLEEGYSGTLVMMAPDESGVLDRPIAGRRLVERR